MLRSAGYHFTVFKAEDNSIEFTFDATGGNKADCEGLLNIELMKRGIYSAKLEGKYKVKAERFENHVKERTIGDIMSQYHLKMSEIAKRFEIPYRTVQNWNSGTNKCPPYIIKMMDEILSKEA